MKNAIARVLGFDFVLNLAAGVSENSPQPLIAPFGGPLAAAREAVTDPAQIVYRPIDAMILPAPWHKGRVLCIGDAAHVPTPHLASGAGLAIEDAIVLSELLQPGAAPETAFDGFMKRRFERCRLVVDNSVQLGAWDLKPGTPGADPAGLVDATMKALAQPI